MATSPILAEPHAGLLVSLQRWRLALRLPLFSFAIIAFLGLSWCEVYNIDVDFHSSLAHNDLVGRWYGTRAALQGQDPFSLPVTRQIRAMGHDVSAAFDYPAHLAVLILPLAVLPWKAASLVYLAVVIPSLALSIWLCIRLLAPALSPQATSLVTLLAFSSWPFVWGIRLWQPGLLTAVFVFFAWFLLSRGHGYGAGILLACATIKPQLVLPLLLGLLLWAGLRRQWSFILSFTFATIILLALAELVVPGWFPHWIAATRSYQAFCGKLPLEILLGTIPSRVLVLSLILGTGWRIWQIRRCQASSAAFGYTVALLLSVAVAITFTIPFMIYNDMLLLPGCVLLFRATSSTTLQLLARRFAQICLAWTFLCVPVAILLRAFSSSPLDWDKLVFLNPFLASAVTLFLLLHPPVGYAHEEILRPALDPTAQSA